MSPSYVPYVGYDMLLTVLTLIKGSEAECGRFADPRIIK